MTDIAHASDNELCALLDEETELEKRLGDFEISYSGLKDIESVCKLASLKLSIALNLLSHKHSTKQPDESRNEQIGMRARTAIRLVEGLVNTRIDETEKSFIIGTSDYGHVKDLLARFILEGGGAFFEQNGSGFGQSELVSRIVVRAIKRWTEREEDLGHPAKKRTPPGRLFLKLKKILRHYFPVFVKESEAGPPYGLADDEDERLLSDHLRLPLSQAVFYLENEVLPRLRDGKSGTDANDELDAQIREVEDQIAMLEKMKFFPRSMPMFPEKGYYTDSITSYTDAGEPIINLRIPVSYRSGTRIEKMQEMVKGEIARKIAGRGIIAKLDAEYGHLKSIESGMFGSTRTPSLKLDIDRAFVLIADALPGLRLIENAGEFRKLVAFVEENGESESSRHIASSLSSTTTYPMLP